MQQMTDAERLAILERKIDRLLDALPTLEIMGELLVPRKDVIEKNGIHRNTLNNKERYEPVGVEKTLIRVETIRAVKKRSGRRKRSASSTE